MIDLLNEETSLGRITAYLIQLLIVISLISFSFSTMPDLTEDHKAILYYIEFFTISIFSIEYVLRIIYSDLRIKYIFSFYGIIDLIAILPFYVSLGLDLRSLRVFRLLLLVRILKLFKYNSAISRFKRALIMAKEEIILFGFISVILLYLSAVGIYYFENEAQPEQFKSVFHSLWWALTTLTTVGYGDMYPITLGGRIFTFFVLLIGLGIISIPTGLIASALSQVRREDDKKENEE